MAKKKGEAFRTVRLPVSAIKAYNEAQKAAKKASKKKK